MLNRKPNQIQLGTTKTHYQFTFDYSDSVDKNFIIHGGVFSPTTDINKKTPCYFIQLKNPIPNGIYNFENFKKTREGIQDAKLFIGFECPEKSTIRLPSHMECYVTEQKNVALISSNIPYIFLSSDVTYINEIASATENKPLPADNRKRKAPEKLKKEKNDDEVVELNLERKKLIIPSISNDSDLEDEVVELDLSHSQTKLDIKESTEIKKSDENEVEIDLSTTVVKVEKEEMLEEGEIQEESDTEDEIDLPKKKLKIKAALKMSAVSSLDEQISDIAKQDRDYRNKMAQWRNLCSENQDNLQIHHAKDILEKMMEKPITEENVYLLILLINELFASIDESKIEFLKQEEKNDIIYSNFIKYSMHMISRIFNFFLPETVHLNQPLIKEKIKFLISNESLNKTVKNDVSIGHMFEGLSMYLEKFGADLPQSEIYLSFLERHKNPLISYASHTVLCLGYLAEKGYITKLRFDQIYKIESILQNTNDLTLAQRASIIVGIAKLAEQKLLKGFGKINFFYLLNPIELKNESKNVIHIMSILTGITSLTKSGFITHLKQREAFIFTLVNSNKVTYKPHVANPLFDNLCELITLGIFKESTGATKIRIVENLTLFVKNNMHLFSRDNKARIAISLENVCKTLQVQHPESLEKLCIELRRDSLNVYPKLFGNSNRIQEPQNSNEKRETPSYRS